MDEQFDKKLSDHISLIFDNFEDHSSNESWLLLREKFPEKKKDRGVIWLWLGSAAAILLLFLGIGTWIKLQKNNPAKISYKPAIANPVKKPASQPQTQQLFVPKHLDVNSKPASKLNLATNNSPKKLANSLASPVNIVKPSVNTMQSNIVTNNAVAKPMINNSINVTGLSNSPYNQTPVASITNDTTNKAKIAVVSPVSENKPEPFVANRPYIPTQKTTENLKPALTQYPVQFGVYAATYFNYASGSQGQLNIGAGVVADIKLTKNLSISTGASIAQNSLNFGNQLPSQSSHSKYFSIATLPLITGNYTTSYPISVLKNYTAQLVALDVPINLKYLFNPQNNNSYVSVGLSSGTFISQSYNSQYGTTIGNATTTQTTTSTFTDFYLAKTLNVAFGLGYHLGKNHLIIEPFLKYPLEGLGAQQIKFGAGGLNLKFDFIVPKK